MTAYTWHDTVDLTALRGLLAEVSAVDGWPSLPQGGGVPDEFRGGQYLIARRDGALVGCVHLAPAPEAERWMAELVVLPADRALGIGTELATRLLAKVCIDPATSPGGRLRVQARGKQPAGAALAARFGFEEAMSLRVMRRDLTDDLPAARWPEGIHLRPFAPGRDEDTVSELHRLAFARRPQQGTMTAGNMRMLQTQPGYEPAGILLAVDGQDRVVGYCWAGVNRDPDDGAQTGHFFALGVHPDVQRGGLGQALAQEALRHLRERRGMSRVTLFVESDNEPALSVYHKVGFTLPDMAVQYVH